MKTKLPDNRKFNDHTQLLAIQYLLYDVSGGNKFRKNPNSAEKRAQLAFFQLAMMESYSAHIRIKPGFAGATQDILDSLQDILDSLNPREAKVLQMSYGIGMDTDHTQKRIGKHFGVIGSVISRIQLKALRKLRHSSLKEQVRLLQIKLIILTDKIVSDLDVELHETIQTDEDILKRVLENSTESPVADYGNLKLMAAVKSDLENSVVGSHPATESPVAADLDAQLIAALKADLENSTESPVAAEPSSSPRKQRPKYDQAWIDELGVKTWLALYSTRAPRPSPSVPPVWLPKKQAAIYIGVNPHTLDYWHSTGKQKIPRFKVGGKVIYNRADLDEWIKSKRVL